ncbi:MAG: hypothetical protein QOI11_2765 [Candidatus Eremiobacteraeota bacterium]|nr:hypothetical protein [Candidatus Eremiobacteraeota bacterium]
MTDCLGRPSFRLRPAGFGGQVGNGCCEATFAGLPAEARGAGEGGTPGSKFAGGHRIRVPPVPIPNTEVKPDTADGTAWETVWESRSLPALFVRKPASCSSRAFLLYASHSHGRPSSCLLLIVPAYIGSAGWNIPRIHRDRFAEDGSQLQRYASRLNAAEINTSFYRPHAATVYQRWAASVPSSFRFAVKVPKVITHERALARAREPLTRFLGEIAGLGQALGPLLVQLPPSFAFEVGRAGRFFSLLRTLHPGPVVCEPRHITWTCAAADRLFIANEIARVAADPPRAAGLESPGGWRRLVYFRWHGSPRPYFSPYSPLALEQLHARIEALDVDAWCIFDNTGSGAAAGNALDVTERLIPPDSRGRRAGTRAPEGTARRFPARDRRDAR